MSNSRVWSEKAMKVLFKSCKELFPHTVTFYDYEDNAREVFAFGVSEEKYNEILEILYKKICKKTDKKPPTGTEAVNTFLNTVFGVKSLAKEGNKRWRAKGLAVAYKVGFIDLEQFINLHEISIKQID